MRIGFDLDKIFIDTPPFIPDIVIERLYRKKSNGILLYRIPKKPEQLIRQLSHYHFFRPTIKKNFSTLIVNAKNRKDKLYLVSSRFGFLEKQTTILAKKHKFHEIFDDMYFNFENKQPHEFKNEMIKKLGINRYVDDDLPLLQHLAARNLKTEFYWLNKKLTKKLSRNIYATTVLDSIFSKL